MTQEQEAREFGDGLRMLGRHGRFRIATERGPRIVTGFWPERDPQQTGGGQ